MKSQKVKNPQEYPEVITTLPKTIVQVKGIKAWGASGREASVGFLRDGA